MIVTIVILILTIFILVLAVAFVKWINSDENNINMYDPKIIKDNIVNLDKEIKELDKQIEEVKNETKNISDSDIINKFNTIKRN